MAIDLDEQDGQTPLDPDEREALIPTHLAIKGDLNDWEQENILHDRSFVDALAQFRNRERSSARHRLAKARMGFQCP